MVQGLTPVLNQVLTQAPMTALKSVTGGAAAGKP